MADVLCDVTQLPKVQKWVTLQPNRNYNTYKTCNTNHRLDMRAIADEISNELLGNRDSRRLINNNGGRFPERTRSGSGRAISNNRLRNLVSKPRRAQKTRNVENIINRRPNRAQFTPSVRFDTADAIASPPQLTSQTFRPLRSELATGGLGDTRFRTGRRPSITPANSKPRRTENYSFSTSPRGFRPQVAVNSFIQQQRSRNENRFILRDTSTTDKYTDSDVLPSERFKSSRRFISSNDCLFGICR